MGQRVHDPGPQARSGFAERWKNALGSGPGQAMNEGDQNGDPAAGGDTGRPPGGWSSGDRGPKLLTENEENVLQEDLSGAFRDLVDLRGIGVTLGDQAPHVIKGRNLGKMQVAEMREEFVFRPLN
jgi:hypothetical protein